MYCIRVCVCVCMYVYTYIGTKNVSMLDLCSCSSHQVTTKQLLCGWDATRKYPVDHMTGSVKLAAANHLISVNLEALRWRYHAILRFFFLDSVLIQLVNNKNPFAFFSLFKTCALEHTPVAISPL